MDAPSTRRPSAEQRSPAGIVLELQAAAGNRATVGLLDSWSSPGIGPPAPVDVQRLLTPGAWKSKTDVMVGKRGGNNPELLEIDDLITHYHTLTDENDADLKRRFQALTSIETRVYRWYNRRFNKAKPGKSARLTAMYDLLDDVADEHQRLVDRVVAEDKDLPVPGVGGQSMAPDTPEYRQAQTLWKAIADETGSISFTSQDAKKQENYPDFKRKMLPQFARLLRTDRGRELIQGLLTTAPGGLSAQDQASGMGSVTVRPTSTAERAAGRVAGAGVKRVEAYQLSDPDRPGGGRGIGSYLSASPEGSETSVTRGGAGHDTRGNTLLSPLFIVLAHEMIHVLHNLMGANRRGVALADWGNLEEKVTISGRDENNNPVDGVSEQAVREEYGLAQVRFGH